MTQKNMALQQDNEWISPLYSEKLKKLLADCSHEGDVTPFEGVTRFSVEMDGVILAVLMDTARNIIRQAAFSGTKSDVERGLFEGLCCVIENLPILECGDHAAIRLEYLLRDEAQPKPVQGIVLPQNADASFLFPRKMARAILAEYRKQTAYSNTENFYCPPLSTVWRQLSNEQRSERIQSAISDFLKQSKLESHAISLSSLDDTVRVTVVFADHLEKSFKEKVLMKIERYLKQILDNNIEVYAEELKDKNKFRRL